MNHVTHEAFTKLHIFKKHYQFYGHTQVVFLHINLNRAKILMLMRHILNYINFIINGTIISLLLTEVCVAPVELTLIGVRILKFIQNLYNQI